MGILAAAGIAAIGYIVMLLWNAIIPDLLKVGRLGFWQALGLLVLCKLLFGGFKMNGGYQNRTGKRWKEKFEAMSEEEREEFKARLKERYGKHNC
ncbi:MAG: hypothetical protein IM600_11750 [Bacteroidetes bacterium]|nr:hypothetical protein [Bacteroidota bacterium]MCA6444093.1 hypothetical protein [Bacteroidota bacterium]